MYYVASIPVGYDYLAHHGIKGMKWGVRRTPEQLGYTPNKGIRGDSVQKHLARRTNKFLNKSEKYKLKIDKVQQESRFTDEKKQKKIEKARKKGEAALAKVKATTHMQDIYNKLSDRDRSMIKRGYIGSRVLNALLSPYIGMPLNSLQGIGRLRDMGSYETYSNKIKENPNLNRKQRKKLKVSTYQTYQSGAGY